MVRVLYWFSVGGIYTVIRSKAFVSTEEMGDNYCLLGKLCSSLAAAGPRAINRQRGQKNGFFIESV